MPLGKFSEYYQESSNKFLAFLLPNTTYRRIILMDADCLILRPPNHLFELPDDIPYAAPKAYWYWNNPQYQDTAFWQVPELRLSRQDFLTSWIMSVSAIASWSDIAKAQSAQWHKWQVRPSVETFSRLQKKMDELIAKVRRNGTGSPLQLRLQFSIFSLPTILFYHKAYTGRLWYGPL